MKAIKLTIFMVLFANGCSQKDEPILSNDPNPDSSKITKSYKENTRDWTTKSTAKPAPDPGK